MPTANICGIRQHVEFEAKNLLQLKSLYDLWHFRKKKWPLIVVTCLRVSLAYLLKQKCWQSFRVATFCIKIHTTCVTYTTISDSNSKFGIKENGQNASCRRLTNLNIVCHSFQDAYTWQKAQCSILGMSWMRTWVDRKRSHIFVSGVNSRQKDPEKFELSKFIGTNNVLPIFKDTLPGLHYRL